MKNIYELANLLNEELLKDEIILKVKETEKIMENDEDYIVLFMEYTKINDEINELSRFNLDVKPLNKKLFEVKLKLDELEVCKNYRKAYLAAKEYLREIANIVVKDLDEEIRVKEY